MFVHHSFAALILAITGLISIFIAYSVFPRRKTPGAIYFFFLMIAVAEWSIADAFEITSVEFSQKVLWSKLSYLSIPSIAPLWLLFVLQYTRRDKWLANGRIFLFWVIPVIVAVLAATNELHGLLWPSVTPLSTEPGALLSYAHGPGVWLDMVYSYTLLLSGTILLIKTTLNSHDLYRRQTLYLIIGAVVPWVGNIIYLSGIFPVKGLDTTPFVFTITGLFIGLGIFRYQLLDLAPIAHDTLFASMKSGVMAIDMQNRLIDFNPAARDLLGIKVSDIGRTIDDTWFPLHAQLHELQNDASGDVTADISRSNGWVEVHLTSLYNCSRQVGRLIVVRDISERKKQENEREKIIHNLEKALSEIKTLRGFLPICSHCKKIRNDEGYWQQIEKYLSEHSEAEFSHGICPDCMSKHYNWLLEP
jgi:PAS domain S-box-containing protein